MAAGMLFSFDFEDNRLQIYANKNWSSRYQSFCTYKTPTCLLLKPDKTISDFGFEASQKYHRFNTKGITNVPSDWQNYYYFRHFKMSLYHKETITDGTPIEAAADKHLPAIIVFSRTIEFLKLHMLLHLQKSGLLRAQTFKPSSKKNKAQQDTRSSLLNPNETRWVVTVPSLWGEPARQLMKRAAIDAGISPERVIIALEPECAAIYCSQLPENQLEIYADRDDIKYVASPESNILVVDIGGGTVDISTLTVCKDSKMKQIHKSGGGIWGGQRINEKILEMLVDIFGQEVMKEFSEHHGNDENNLLIGIEREKRTLKDSTYDEDEDIGFQIDFPDSLRRICEDKHPKREINAILKGKPVTFEAGQLIFQSDKIRQYFQETGSSIIKYLKEVLNDPLLNDIKINAMIVVGGFAESNYLIDCLRTGLTDKTIPIVRPQESELAVLKGAVLFGHDETLIVSRVMTHTIGIAMTMKFDPEKHEEKEMYIIDGNKFANNVFRRHVQVGESVRLGEWIHSKKYHREDLNETKATVYIYSSDRKNPVHTTEVGCDRIGQFDVFFGETESVTKEMKFKQSVNVEFHFGGTELRVRAITTVDGKTSTEYLSIV